MCFFIGDFNAALQLFYRLFAHKIRICSNFKNSVMVPWTETLISANIFFEIFAQWNFASQTRKN